MAFWNPWKGCYNISDGCLNCYYYGINSKQKGSPVIKTDEFNKPLETKAGNKYKIEPGKEVATCFMSDFFLPEADEWRIEAWEIIKKRHDLKFMFITKRIDRFNVSLPEDWGDGYDNVSIGCTCENQAIADYRLPIFLSLPIKHKFIVCTPLLSDIDLTPYLSEKIDIVTAGGEAGKDARECSFDWILKIREQCQNAGIRFWFKCTGAKFRKDGILYKIPPNRQHSQAREANLNL